MKNIGMLEITKDISVLDALLELELATNAKEASDFIRNLLISIDNAIVTTTNSVISYSKGNYSVLKRGRGKYALIVHL
jgi:tyrosyl-tRNA synthetase